MIDLSTMPEGYLGAGAFDVEIVKVENGWHGSDQTIEVTMRDIEGRGEVRKKFFLGERSAAFFRRFAIDLGYSRDSRFKSEDMIGKRVRITLKMGAPNRDGKSYAELESHVPYREGAAVPPPVNPSPTTQRSNPTPPTSPPPRRSAPEHRAPSDDQFLSDGSPVPEEDDLPF